MMFYPSFQGVSSFFIRVAVNGKPFIILTMKQSSEINMSRIFSAMKTFGGLCWMDFTWALRIRKFVCYGDIFDIAYIAIQYFQAAVDGYKN